MTWPHTTMQLPRTSMSRVPKGQSLRSATESPAGPGRARRSPAEPGGALQTGRATFVDQRDDFVEGCRPCLRELVWLRNAPQCCPMQRVLHLARSGEAMYYVSCKGKLGTCANGWRRV